MAATFNYDDPVANVLNASTSAPNNKRNLDRMSHTFATVSGTIALDASYPTGGYALSPAKFGLTTVSGVLFEDTAGYGVVYNRTTDKVQVYSTGNTEVANATNLSTLQAVYFEAKGLV